MKNTLQSLTNKKTLIVDFTKDIQNFIIDNQGHDIEEEHVLYELEQTIEEFDKIILYFQNNEYTDKDLKDIQKFDSNVMITENRIIVKCNMPCFDCGTIISNIIFDTEEKIYFFTEFQTIQEPVFKMDGDKVVDIIEDGKYLDAILTPCIKTHSNISA